MGLAREPAIVGGIVEPRQIISRAEVVDNGPMPESPQRLTKTITEVESIAFLVWLSDTVLLAARGRGEVDPLHLIVALGVTTGAAALAALVTRSYRSAVALLIVAAAACVWFVRFGPTIHSPVVIGAAILLVAAAILIDMWLRPNQLGLAIPALMLAHQFIVIRHRPGIGPLIAALILTALMPWLSRAIQSKPRVLLSVCTIAVAAAVIAVVLLRDRVELHHWTDQTRKPPPGRGANVVLLVLDTLRADRVGAFGYDARPVTPFLDDLAKRSVVFPRAYASSSWTIPSVASMFTGLTAGAHGVVTGASALPRRQTTLPEILRREGYFTTGISANFALDDETGFTRGFDRYTVLWRLIRGNRSTVPSIWDDINAPLLRYYDGWKAPIPGWNMKPRAVEVTRRAIAEVDDAPRDRPLFLYVQYLDPHAPCDAAGTDDWRPSSSDQPFDEDWSVEYDREIRNLDRALAGLVQHIDARLDPRNTMLIIVADHGEQLGESGERGHGTNLSEATIRVPLLVRFPAGMSAPDANNVFATMRIFDLITKAAGLPSSTRDTRFVHSSLLVGRTVQRSVSDGTHKLVQHWTLDPPHLERESLFQLPDEARNVLSANPAAAETLRAAVDADPLPRAADVISDESRAKLRALGYLR